MYILREIEKGDMLTINKWRNKKELIEYLGAPYRYINLDTDYKWYENYLNARNNTIRCAILSVENENENEILGLVSLTDIDMLNQKASFHIMIGDLNNRQKGIGYFASIEILKHAFSNMNLNRIELKVLCTNTRAIKLYEKVGFKREGIMKESIYKNGEFVDMIIMAVLKQEYLKK